MTIRRRGRGRWAGGSAGDLLRTLRGELRLAGGCASSHVSHGGLCSATPLFCHLQILEDDGRRHEVRSNNFQDTGTLHSIAAMCDVPVVPVENWSGVSWPLSWSALLFAHS